MRPLTRSEEAALRRAAGDGGRRLEVDAENLRLRWQIEAAAALAERLRDVLRDTGGSNAEGLIAQIRAARAEIEGRDSEVKRG